MDFRKEYPDPQFERENWMNLNGVWRFAFDFGKSGMERISLSMSGKGRTPLLFTLSMR